MKNITCRCKIISAIPLLIVLIILLFSPLIALAEQAYSVIGEIGQTSLNHSWKSISLNNSYTNPVVIAQPLSFRGGNPAHIRLKNIGPDSFELKIEEWAYLDGWHTTETISYLVIEAGTHLFADGKRLEAGKVSTDQTWKEVTFQQVFLAAPIVLTQAQTLNNTDPIVTRKQNVHTAGCELRLQKEEARKQEDYALEELGYLAIEPGIGINNGNSYEAGRTSDSVTHAWHSIEFSQAFDLPPLYLGDIQTFDGGDTAGMRYRNLRTAGIEIFIEEETSLDSEIAHTTEVTGYLLFESSGDIAVQNYPPAIDPPLPNITTAKNTALTYDLTIHENDVEDSDSNLTWFVSGVDTTLFTADVDSVTDILAITPVTDETGSDTVVLTLSDSKGLTASQEITVAVIQLAEENQVIGEIGQTSLNHSWKSISLNNSYTNPVVIAQPLSFRGGNPAHIRLKNIGPDSFELKIEEWAYLDGWHTTETISYLVIEAGTHLFADGKRLEAGKVSTDQTWKEVTFQQVFLAAPIVLTQAQTLNNTDPIVTRKQNVHTAGCELRLQKEEARKQEDYALEELGYLAIEPGIGINNGNSYEAGRTSDSVTHAWHSIEFSQAFDLPPLYLGDIQTFDGGDTAGMRYRNLRTAGIEIFIEEETSLDSEIAHTTEVTGYLLFESSGDIAVSDNILPTVLITAPQNRAFLSGGVDISADAQDNVGIDKVELHINDILKTVNFSAPYSWNWDTVAGPDGSYTIKTAAYDAAENSAYDEISVTIDNTPPSIPTLKPVTSPTGQTSQTLTGSKGVDTSIWINGVERVTLNSSTSWSADVSLSEGENTFRISAKDKALNESPAVIANILLDNSSPETPVVIDDGVYTALTTQLHATWSSVDAQTGIAEYQYAIGRTAGVVDVIDWTSTGMQSEVTHTGLSLTQGQSYYISVKAKNGIGLWSKIGSSDGIKLNQSLPAILSIQPPDESSSYAEDNIDFSVDAQDQDGDSLLYRFSLDGQIIQPWQGSPKFNWSTSEVHLGIHTMKVEVSDNNGGVVSQNVGLCLFRKPHGPPSQ